jgi:aryl-alcohol dehydrogenase-like predicted oxidoreductase
MRTPSPSTTGSTRRLGAHGPAVFPLSLGCMGMSATYGPADEAESVATIHEALDAGVTLLDTGDFYGAGRNELLLGRALAGRRDGVLLSVKFGALRAPGGGFVGFDARPASVKNFLTHTLTRLGVDHVDIYRPSRLDPAVPIEDTVGAIAEMVKGGYVRYVGLSEVGPETIRRAHAVHPIADLQIEYSLVSRSPEERIFPVLRELGIGVTAYGALSRPAPPRAAPGTSAPTSPASAPRTGPATSASSTRSAPSPPAGVSARRSWRSRGCWRRARPSCPSWARARGPSWPTRSGRSR